MVWPFGRKKERPAAASDGPKAGALPTRSNTPTPEDLTILDDCAAWLGKERTGITLDKRPDVGNLHVGTPPQGALAPGAPCGAVLKAKRGKLSWVDLYDPELRPLIDQLVKHLDKQQRWYFNGVIATKYDESLVKRN